MAWKAVRFNTDILNSRTVVQTVSTCLIGQEFFYASAIFTRRVIRTGTIATIHTADIAAVVPSVLIHVLVAARHAGLVSLNVETILAG